MLSSLFGRAAQVQPESQSLHTSVPIPTAQHVHEVTAVGRKIFYSFSFD